MYAAMSVICSTIWSMNQTFCLQIGTIHVRVGQNVACRSRRTTLCGYVDINEQSYFHQCQFYTKSVNPLCQPHGPPRCFYTGHKYDMTCDQCTNYYWMLAVVTVYNLLIYILHFCKIFILATTYKSFLDWNCETAKCCHVMDCVQYLWSNKPVEDQTTSKFHAVIVHVWCWVKSTLLSFKSGKFSLIIFNTPTSLVFYNIFSIF